MQLVQIAHIVGCVAPVDLNGAARLGAHINMSKYNHVSFIIYFGAMAAAQTVTVLAGTDSLGTGGVAMAFNYRISTGGVPLLAPLNIGPLTVIVGAGGVALAGTEDNEIMVIEMDAAELVAPATNYYVGVNLSNSASVTIATVVAVCLEPRYQADPDLMPDPTVV